MTESLHDRLEREPNLWFPNLSNELLRMYVERRGLSPGDVDGYGTARWLGSSPEQPELDNVGIRIGSHTAKIEYLAIDAAQRFQGLTFRDRQPPAHEQVQAAVNLLAPIPGMTDGIGSVVRSIHLLTAPPDHDISHSTPELPFSVFVSVPEPTERHASLRIAESLIHEAMHLRLTLIDEIEPLIEDASADGFSPWKDETRPLTGLLHGLYVFAVIDRALDLLAATNSQHKSYSHARRRDIAAEVASLDRDQVGFSVVGNKLWTRCIASVAAK